MKELWILAEVENGKIAGSYYELLSKASEVYAESSEEMCFSAVCLTSDESVCNELVTSGADKVICVSDEKLGSYNPSYYASALAEIAKSKEPEIILVPASAVGSEVGPSVAAKLGTGLAAHCTDLKLGEDGVFHMMIPAFGGKMMGDDIIPTARPIMASIKPGVFERQSLPEKEAELVITSVDLEENCGIELVSSEIIETGDKPIDKADVIICAGHGSGSAGVVDDLKILADKLGASLGYTRPLVDLGYFDNENSMIGTSGKTVKPKLYVGFGASGASHHVCGMKDSRMIININNDEEADCFKVSNYKAIGDCKEIVKEMLARL